jgi:hypothetical protein
MKEKNTSKVLFKCGITAIIGAVLSLGVMWGRGLFAATTVNEVFAYISDGFFVIGFIFAGIGLSMAIAQTGTFDMLGYAFKSLIYLFTPRTIDRSQGGFYEYKMRKKEKRQAVPLYILWVGIAYVVLALILLGVYYAV